jgi:hypothetical protein
MASLYTRKANRTRLAKAGFAVLLSDLEKQSDTGDQKDRKIK